MGRLEITTLKENVMDAQDEKKNVDRREFILTSTMAALATGAATLTKPFSVFAAEPGKAAEKGTYPAKGMAAYGPKQPLRLMNFERRPLGPKDVAIKVLYCGVCHSDIHTVRQDWGKVQYPLIVGHELSGEVVEVGSEVSKFKKGARVGVGTMVNSCRTCSECKAGRENYCLNGNTPTDGSTDKDGSITQGGYSTFIVVDQDFVINFPESIELIDGGPLLCAGVTVYSPMKHWNVSEGKKVAILGMGGLGHLAVMLAKALGAEVTVFTTSPEKTEDAKKFGATNVVINKKGEDYANFKHSFDFILDTIPYKHELNPFIPLLKPDATLCRVGVGKVTDSNEIGQMNLVLYRNALAGSNTGGIRETQEFVDFCAAKKIKPQITKISMSEIYKSWDTIVRKNARYRFVVDMTNS
jgi:uncharacterized zinc-type alcohol dehydrogenase-like protein